MATNEQIIFNERFALMEAGIIGTTGRMLTVHDEKGRSVVPEPEILHTFMGWKGLNRTVKKGEKAVASFPIWKHVVKEPEDKDSEPEERMFMVRAFFFTEAQTEPASEKTGKERGKGKNNED